jgi:hypothetical protein
LQSPFLYLLAAMAIFDVLLNNYRMTDQASISFSRLQAALAGLVDGRQTAPRPVVGSIYLWYMFQDVLPLQQIISIGAVFSIGERSFGITSLILESDDPTMVHW